MAFLLRLRKIPSLSSHHRLISTSRGVSGSSNPNSNRPSPSFLREVSEAIKILDDPTPFHAFPSLKMFKPLNSEPLTVEQMKVNMIMFMDRYFVDRYLIMDMKFTRRTLFHEFSREVTMFNSHFAVHTLSGNVAQPGTQKTMRRKLNTILKSFNKLVEMSAEDGEFSIALVNFRLASLEELVDNFSELKTNHGEVEEEDFWNEINQVLMRRKKMLLEEAEYLSERVKYEQGFILSLVEKLAILCRHMPYMPLEKLRQFGANPISEFGTVWYINNLYYCIYC